MLLDSLFQPHLSDLLVWIDDFPLSARALSDTGLLTE